MRRFNVTGLCVPSEDYMVDISGKLEKIRELIDDGCYFTINRARQYGKTTTLNMIQKTLPAEYICARISFEGLGEESFASPEVFCPTILRQISKALEFTGSAREYTVGWLNNNATNFELLSDHITRMCSGKKLVLIIDEVDRTRGHVWISKEF